MLQRWRNSSKSLNLSSSLVSDFLIQNVAFIVLCPVNAHDASSPEANKKQIISLKMYFIKHKISQTFFLYSLFIYF